MVATPNANTVLTASDVSFGYALKGYKKSCIQGLSLVVERKEIVCILGASGCGKSTLLNLIADLLQPDSGTIVLAGSDRKHGHIGYIFQEDALLPWRTVHANLMLQHELTGTGSSEQTEARISTYLKAFHLDAGILKQYPAELSGGMRQRVSIIQSLMFDPELLLLDEPFCALDFFTKVRLEEECHQLIKENSKACILVTHDIEEAIAMSDRILIMGMDGTFTREFLLHPETIADWRPETARGHANFAEFYRNIWSELKAVIQ